MASENLLEDENARNVIGAITDTGEIRMGRINPITNAIIVEATVTSNNTSIGSTIPGATAGSIFFAGLGGTLAQDNAHLFYDDTNNFVGFGTNTPLATLHVVGSLEFDLGSDATGDTYFRNDSGFVERLPIGTAGDVLTVTGGIPTWTASAPLLSGYNLIKNENVAVTQRSTINLSNLLLAADNAGQTDMTVNVTELAGDSTFVDALVANTYFTTELANDSNFITELTSNATFISNVSTEISGTVAVVSDGVTITGDGTVGDPLTAVGGSSLVVSVNQTAHGLSVGDVIYCSGSDTYDKALAISTGLVSNAVGIVTTVTDADNFIYSVIVTELTTALTGTEGAAVWLSATTAGAMTMTNPSSVNASYLDIPVGTLLASGSKMQFNISQGSNEGLAGGGSSGSSVFEQVLCSQSEGTAGQSILPVQGTSDTTGDNHYVIQYNTDTDAYLIWRFIRDAVTGAFYYSNQDSPSISMSGSGRCGIVVLGDYVYIFSDNGGVITCERFDLDLNNNVAMTVAGSPGSQIICGAFTDGTKLYTHTQSSTSGKEFSVSGTTITFVQDVTMANNSATVPYNAYWFDGSNIYNGANGVDIDLIEKSGTVFSTAGTLARPQNGWGNSGGNGVSNTCNFSGIWYGGANSVYIVYSVETPDGSSSDPYVTFVKPSSKPTA